MFGRTGFNCVFESHCGQLMDVKITRAGSFTLYGDTATLGED